MESVKTNKPDLPEGGPDTENIPSNAPQPKRKGPAPKYTPEEKRERRKVVQRAWYLKRQEELKAMAVERYYADHERLKTAARERARAKKARVQEMEEYIAKVNPGLLSKPPSATD